MGGWKHTELGGHSGPPPRRAARSGAPAAVAAALALGMLLWGAAFPCAGNLAAHGFRVAVARAHHPAHSTARGVEQGPARYPARASAGRPVHVAAPGSAPGSTHADCVAPSELPGCAPRSDTPLAVLPVPPSALAAVGAGAVVGARPACAGPVRAPGTLARAPDLHALQVLRT
ncbi:hypothetical protein [Streptomyces sp. A1136]|uniref:hypothetical protein n=1 Tax=Streptomyces sp. A1136 TaxID=2563102 RepID=UPI00109E58D0|nr:hypothetical protein [Streptomyces sp. A1136]THA51151.1 hypothetical protein E6R62_23755 [Streptomyces sp. A1136]